MKRFNLLTILLAVVVTFTAVSCTTTQGASDDYYENSRQVGNRIYVDDPYRGTVVLERDPYTGRYYDVTNSYGSYSNRYSPYGYDPYYRTNPYYRNRTIYAPQQQQQTEEQRQDWQRQRDEARRKVLGRN